MALQESHRGATVLAHATNKLITVLKYIRESSSLDWQQFALPLRVASNQELQAHFNKPEQDAKKMFGGK